MLFFDYILKYTLRCSIKRAVLMTLNWSRLQWKLKFLLLIYGCFEINCQYYRSRSDIHTIRYKTVWDYCSTQLILSKRPWCSSTSLQWPNSFMDFLTDVLFIISQRNEFGHVEKPRNPTNSHFYLLEAQLLYRAMLMLCLLCAPFCKPFWLVILTNTSYSNFLSARM